jgi:pre-rRNA-processing protein IPI1
LARSFSSPSQPLCEQARVGRTQVKVGRKIEKTTETQTSFKAKKLSIAKQSLAVDRDGQEVNSRGLTLREILVQTAHYSPNVRKEAVAGLRDFFTLHPATLPVHAGAVFDKVSHFVTDQVIGWFAQPVDAAFCVR